MIQQAPRFAATYCSQCGGAFGTGYSHCDQHHTPEADSDDLGLNRAFDAALPPKIPLSGAEPSDYSDAVERINIATEAYLDFVQKAADPLSQYRDDKIAVALDDCLGCIRDNVSDLTGKIKECFDRAQEDARPKSRHSAWA